MNLDPERFKPDNGVLVPLCRVHVDHLLRPNDAARIGVAAQYDTNKLTVLGCELWHIVLLSRKDDGLHALATSALIGGDRAAYAVLLDKLEEDGVLDEDEIAQSRTVARLWQDGFANRRLEDEVRRLYGPRVRPEPEKVDRPSPWPDPNSTYVPQFGS